jgi:phage shock protein PspC (stress-responsive transcriptional regulator)
MVGDAGLFFLIMKLRRSNEDRRLAGVCGGLAAELELDSSRLRLVWVLATLFTAFAGVVLYLALWYLIPRQPPRYESPPLQPWKKAQL